MRDWTLLCPGFVGGVWLTLCMHICKAVATYFCTDPRYDRATPQYFQAPQQQPTHSRDPPMLPWTTMNPVSDPCPPAYLSRDVTGLFLNWLTSIPRQPQISPPPPPSQLPPTLTPHHPRTHRPHFLCRPSSPLLRSTPTGPQTATGQQACLILPAPHPLLARPATAPLAQR